MRLAYLKPIIVIVLIAGSIAITHAADSKGKRPNILFCLPADSEAPSGKIFTTEVAASSVPLVANSKYQIWIPDNAPTVRSNDEGAC